MRFCSVSAGNVLAAESLGTEVAKNPSASITDKDVQRQGREFVEAVFKRDLDELQCAIAKCHREWLLACRRGHPAEQAWLHGLQTVQGVRHLPLEQQEEYLLTLEAWHRSADGIAELVCEAMPNPLLAATVFDRVRSARDRFHAFGFDAPGVVDCDLALIRECSLVREWGTALNRIHQFVTDWQPRLGQDAEIIQIMRLFESMVLMELSEDAPRQVRLAESFISFVDRYRLEGLYVFWRERGMTVLAEIQFRAGNRREADRVYAEVRSRLPENSDHWLAGWCRSWCDRHEARRLMEKGDYEGAEEKISSARLGTIKYGHRNLNKGLTMERILRMSAEIRRKLGRDKEADEDLAYAQRIVDNVAKLKAALQADLEKPGRPTESTPLSPSDSAHRSPQTMQ
jgi:hypothetical protein